MKFPPISPGYIFKNLAPCMGALALFGWFLFVPQTVFAFSFESDVYSGDHKIHAILSEHFAFEFSPAIYSGTDDDSDGIPDLVEELAEYAENSWDKEIDELNMPSPLDTQDKVYVILDDLNFYLSLGALGVTGILPTGETYIAVDPFLSSDLLKVTIAHEFFHVIQFGYQGYFAGYDQDINFAEGTAVWVEEYVYDEVNDYYDYLYHYFDHTDYSIFTGIIPDGSLFEYALSIWPIFLSEYYDDWTQTKDVVDAYFAEENPDVWDAFEAYREVISAEGGDLRLVFQDFAYWNYVRSYYEEGTNYPAVDIHKSYGVNDYPVASGTVKKAVFPALYGANYLQFAVDSSMEDEDFQFTLTKSGDVDFGVVILPETDTLYLESAMVETVIEAPHEEGTITIPIGDDYALFTVMITPLSLEPADIESDDEAFGVAYPYHFNVEIGDFLSEDEAEIAFSEDATTDVSATEDDKEGDAAGENLDEGWGETIEADELTVSELSIASIGEDSITLSWTRVNEAAGYYVYYGTESGVYDFSEMVEGGYITHLTVSDLWPQTLYFVVTAYDNDYNESSYYSNEVEAILDGVTFTDIYSSHRNYNAIKFLTYLGVLEGYSDGTFKPNNEINRAELMKVMVYGWLGEQPDADEYSDCFPDVKDEWFAPYVCYAKERGWVQGYRDGNFYPANTVSKVEALKMILEAYGVDVPESASLKDLPYKDVYSSSWYAPYLKAAYDMGLLEETGASFEPNDGRTRAEVSEEIYRLLVLDLMWEGIFNEDVENSFLEEWSAEFL